MKFSYRFSNLLGSVYRKGNVVFTPDGNSVISPVGNRVTVFDLKNNRSETLPIESGKNITCIALSPDGYTMILVNEDGEGYLCSLISKTVLSTYHFHQPVHQVKFSPDGKKFAVTRNSVILVFHAPGKRREFNPFQLFRTYQGAYDETVCIDWTLDSKVLCAGSKDMNTRVHAVERLANLTINSLGGHNDAIVAAYFAYNSLDVFTISQNGHLCVWECDTKLEDLRPYIPKVHRGQGQDDDLDDQENPDSKETEMDTAEPEDRAMYQRVQKFSYKEARGAKAKFAFLTSAAFHKTSAILVSGFQDGSFFLHEMPDFNLIHSLNVSDQSIASMAFNNTGDWLALGCGGMGQLLVWEWQSETYVLKQQGHFNNMGCLAYSPDGQNIATGGDDGKVKVWNTSSGFCFVTFTEHLGGITGVTFNQNGQVVLSASLDGSVRAFDLNRYRNFRTFTSPRPCQFSCLAVDHSGDIVCAGGLDTFEVFVWSMQTGRLLEVLTGHVGPISTLSFSSNQSFLATGSWDKSVKLWDVFENKGVKETLQFNSDVLAVAFRPDGGEVAVANLNAQITFWNPNTATQTGSIEGRHDLGYFRSENDKITARKAAEGKAFTTICYSADGQCLLAAGQSKNVCIYSVPDQMLIKKFEISRNYSFDGMEEFLDRRKMTQWGSLSLVDDGKGDQDGTAISLPGVKKGDMSSRHWKPEVRVAAVQFSPTGRAWASATTEGLLVYSLDHNLVFDPFDLEMDITPENVRKTLQDGDYSISLMLSFRLNEVKLIQEVLESIPVSNVPVICENLPNAYIDKLLAFLANQMEATTHLQFYMIWINKILMFHGPQLKQRSQSIMATLRMLQKGITRKHEDLGKICDHNKYSIGYIKALSQAKRKRVTELGSEDESDEVEEEKEDDSEDENFMSNLMNSVT
ncbi:periodic tryptophan protein 2 homolog [Mizuhopecten yessoensis]|uniref:Periodic tryptophan protein 2-like n=1 Tax=Mizuhopecten yessoensis TaxID=6573 RepID=A0A210QVU5_MIZYE|nr:periodic tryptophan protein 2 homolog [Mizuhopecten yessoensis]OWF52888.1 Periodic tryptophan protein 2-like [Mizuhopecten yessoensis]